MTFIAIRLLPQVPHILRVLERKPTPIQSCWQGVAPLVENSVTAIAVLGYHPSRRVSMFAIMTPEAPKDFHVPDIVWIRFPAYVHAGKKIVAILSLEFLCCLVYEVLLLFSHVRILLLVVLREQYRDGIHC